MTATSMYERLGGTSFPFPAASVDNTKLTLEPLDPLAATIAALLKQAINSELGAAWTKVTNSLGSSHPLYGTSPVQSTLVGLAPDQLIVQERRIALPLLAVHRVGKATYSDWSNLRRQREQTWNVHYILGALDAAAAWKLVHILHGIPALVDLVLDRRRHPTYASNAIQFDDVCEVIKLVSHEAGQASFAEREDTQFYATLMELQIVEVTDQVDTNPDLETFEGAEQTIDLYNENESSSPIEEFIIVDTNPTYVPP